MLPSPFLARTTAISLVVSFVVEPQDLSIASVSDSKGNTYYLAVGPTPVSDWGELYTYYASNIVGGGAPITITITFSGPCQYETIYAAEYSGIKASSPLDQIASSYGNSASWIPDRGPLPRRKN